MSLGGKKIQTQFQRERERQMEMRRRTPETVDGKKLMSTRQWQ
jgi:hypothetical protein